MSLFRFGIQLCLILFLFGCSAPARKVKETRIPLPFSTNMPVLNSPTITGSLEPQVFPTVSIVAADVGPLLAQNEVDDLVFSECLDVHSGNMGPYGSLFVIDGHTKTPYVLDLESLSKTNVRPLDGVLSSFFPSPDGKWIAYIIAQGVEGELLVVDTPDNLLAKTAESSFSWQGNYPFTVEGWLDNERLIVTQGTSPDTFFSTLIVNPFTTETTVFTLENLPNFKSFISSGVGIYHFPNGNVFPDPTLKRLVYPKFTDANYVTLWDLETNSELASVIDSNPFYTSNPLWNQDGENFLITLGMASVGEEIFQVNRAGNIMQQTQFTSFLLDNHIKNVSRSLDGRFVSFQMRYLPDLGSGDKTRYFVLDLSLTKKEGFCIESKSEFIGGSQAPVWSPDNQYIVISNTTNYCNGELILIELGKREAYKLADDVCARGWVTFQE